MPRAMVAGGSIAGLCAALALRASGFKVTVHERAGSRPGDRGGGIVAHETSLRGLTGEGGRRLDELTVPSRSLRYLDRTGRVAYEEPSSYRFTSWQTLHSGLLALAGEDCYRWGSALEDFRQDDSVTARFSDARTERADVLICADGISSTAREKLVPGCRPRYAGYVGWRGIVPAAETEGDLFEALGSDITYQLLGKGHILAYPIPAPPRTTGTRGGRRRCLNWVWYRNVTAGPDLDRLRTDVAGVVHDLSVPPGALHPGCVAEMRSAAAASLEPTLAALVLATRTPFIQVIVDVEVQRMTFGRICLAGDAAFAARPHAAAGTAKAAADAWRLGQVMREYHGDAVAALGAYEQTQLALGRALVDRSRTLGDAVQFAGSWRPGDPALRFGLYRAGDSAFPAR
ncbi:MAG TPA: FAD-dependent monooxygenase [Streptosporangiaceae bacterium]|nr:FAD-dependent monooxygenase [Streptosporangiaceae bacterium]